VTKFINVSGCFELEANIKSAYKVDSTGIHVDVVVVVVVDIFSMWFNKLHRDRPLMGTTTLQ